MGINIDFLEKGLRGKVSLPFWHALENKIINNLQIKGGALMKKLVCFLPFVFFGCATMTTMQTAETLKPGENILLGGAYQTIQTSNDTGSIFDSLKYYSIEAATRIGAIENVDFGLKVFPVGAQLDGKYCFSNGNKLKMSGDLALGYLTIESGSDSNKVKNSIVDIVPSILFTAKLHDMFSMTLTPKTLLRVAFGTGKTSTNYLAGGTFGFKIGNKTAILPEVGYYVGKDYNFIQYGAAIQITK